MKFRVLHEARLVADNLALDFVNTSTGRNVSESWDDYLIDAMEVLMWLRRAKAIDETRFRAMTRVVANDKGASDAFLRSALRLRGALAGLFDSLIKGLAPVESDLRVLNDVLATARNAERVTWTPQGIALVAAWDGRSLDDALWPIALTVEQILTSKALLKVKECGSPTCKWLFLDTSKNGSRRWCQMEVCGNREKGRRRLKRERESDQQATSRL